MDMGWCQRIQAVHRLTTYVREQVGSANLFVAWLNLCEIFLSLAVCDNH